MLIDHAITFIFKFLATESQLFFYLLLFVISFIRAWHMCNPVHNILFLFPFTFIGSIFQFQGDTSTDA